MDNKDGRRILHHNETESILFPLGKTSGPLLIVEQMTADGFRLNRVRAEAAVFNAETLRPKNLKSKVKRIFVIPCLIFDILARCVCTMAGSAFHCHPHGAQHEIIFIYSMIILCMFGFILRPVSSADFNFIQVVYVDL